MIENLNGEPHIVHYSIEKNIDHTYVTCIHVCI